MKRKTIIHFIVSLERGGAETMLVQVLKQLKEFNNIVVTLNDRNHFKEDLECDEYICLHKPTFRQLPISILKFHSLISKYKPDVVHSHLALPNFIARLATPRNIPLINTIHTSVSRAEDYKKLSIRLLEKFTYHYRRPTIISVSNIARNDYFSLLKINPAKQYVLHTFVNERRFHKFPDKTTNSSCLKIISVGALRKGKNYLYLVEAFKKLTEQKIELHIYGAGPQQNLLQQAINSAGVNIKLKGQVENINEILPYYDLFVMPSLFEGFSLSVLEAMAAKLPLLLSNIPSFKEQCEDTAVYFNLNDTNDFCEKLKNMLKDRELLVKKGKQAYQRAVNNFTLRHHLEKLFSVYNNVLQT
jgi:glycosyltransferase involved in cell wall biosynthesis